MSRGIGGHARPNEGRTDVWLTPPEILAKLGPFDCDPCAAIDQPWRTASVQYTKRENGLTQPWVGRVWLNPPYGSRVGYWTERLADHGDGIALVFARTDTDWFQRAAARADGLLLLWGRLCFCRADGTQTADNSGAPSCFLAYGERNVRSLTESGLRGILVAPRADDRALARSLFGAAS